jgi:hypothetical protein
MVIICLPSHIIQTPANTHTHTSKQIHPNKKKNYVHTQNFKAHKRHEYKLYLKKQKRETLYKIV